LNEILIEQNEGLAIQSHRGAPHNATTLPGARVGRPRRVGPALPYVDVRYTIPVPVRGRGRAVWSYIGVVGVVGVAGAKAGDGSPRTANPGAANPGDGGARAYGDGERDGPFAIEDDDGERRDTDVADVETDSALDVEVELASDEAVELAARPTFRTAGTGTGARSPPSTGWRGCNRSGRICGFGTDVVCISGAISEDAGGGPGCGVLCIERGVCDTGICAACGNDDRQRSFIRWRNERYAWCRCSG